MCAVGYSAAHIGSAWYRFGVMLIPPEVLAWPLFAIVGFFAGRAEWMRRYRYLFSKVQECQGLVCTKCEYPLIIQEAELCCPECGCRASADELRRAWRKWLGTEGEGEKGNGQ